MQIKFKCYICDCISFRNYGFGLFLFWQNFGAISASYEILLPKIVSLKYLRQMYILDELFFLNSKVGNKIKIIKK